jgi:hypothetical protein
MKISTLAATLAALAVSFPLPAHAKKAKPIAAAPKPTLWADSFPANALGTYLDSEGTAVLVAAAGDAAKGAARALTEAFRATGKTRLVLDDAALGDLSSSSDADIVGKAHGSPADIVVVVRVFPPSAQKQPTAVVTFFSKKSGSTLAAFTVARGTEVAARSTASAVPTAALENTVPPEPAAEQKEAVDPAVTKVLEERAIWNDNDVAVNVYTGNASVTRKAEFFRGKNGPRLEGASLYEYLGREDLATSYRSRHSTERVLEWGGLAGLVLVGPGLMITGAVVPGPCTTIDSASHTCTANQGDPLVYVGLAVMGAGLVAALIGLFMDPNPVSSADVFQLVDAFNDDLKKKTAQAATAQSSVDRTQRHWRMDTFAVRGGAGVSFGLTF